MERLRQFSYLLHKGIGALTILLSGSFLFWFISLNWMVLIEGPKDPAGVIFLLAFSAQFVIPAIIGFFGAIAWFKFYYIGYWAVLLFFSVPYTWGILSLFQKGGASADVMQQFIPAIKGQTLLFTIPLLTSSILWIKPLFSKDKLGPISIKKLVAYLVITFAIVLAFLTGLTIGLSTLLILVALIGSVLLLRRETQTIFFLNVALLLLLIFAYWYPCFSGFETTKIPSYNIDPSTGEQSFLGYTKIVKNGCGWEF